MWGDILKKSASILCTLLLLCSFGLHALQVKHTHYGLNHVHAAGETVQEQNHSHSENGHESLAEKMHMAEKKFIYFALGATLIFYVFSPSPFLIYQSMLLYSFQKIISIQKRLTRKIFSFLRLFYATGILNPKPF